MSYGFWGLMAGIGTGFLIVGGVIVTTPKISIKRKNIGIWLIAIGTLTYLICTFYMATYVPEF